MGGLEKTLYIMWIFSNKHTISDSGILRGMTDCHSHILPGVDDGIKSMTESLSLLDSMEQQGITRVWLTPHIMEDYPNTTAALRERFAELQVAYTGGIELHLAAEYMLDSLFEERLEADDLLPLDEDRRYLLVETSYFNPPMNMHSILRGIQSRGYYPLLAHPERYRYMDMDEYRTLRDMRIAFQLNVPSLTGMYGRSAQEKAETLLRAQMYDIKGCDMHSPEAFRAFCDAKVKKWVREK